MKRTLVVVTVALLVVMSMFGASAEKITEVFNVSIDQKVDAPNVESSFDIQMGITHVIPAPDASESEDSDSTQTEPEVNETEKGDESENGNESERGDETEKGNEAEKGNAPRGQKCRW